MIYHIPLVEISLDDTILQASIRYQFLHIYKSWIWQWNRSIKTLGMYLIVPHKTTRTQFEYTLTFSRVSKLIYIWFVCWAFNGLLKRWTVQNAGDIFSMGHIFLFAGKLPSPFSNPFIYYLCFHFTTLENLFYLTFSLVDARLQESKTLRLMFSTELKWNKYTESIATSTGMKIRSE